MKSPASIQLGPWIRGIQNIYDPAMTPKGCVVEADNVLIESDGTVVPRLGYALVATGCHSLFRHAGKVYGIFNNQVCELFESGARPLSALTIDGKVTWGVLNDEPVFTNSTILARISGGTVKKIGVEMPTVQATAFSTIDETAVAVSFVNADGEEGPLSPIFGGGNVVLPAEATVTKMRVYTTQVTEKIVNGVSQRAPGDMLYLLYETLPGGVVNAASAEIVSAPIGKPAETMNKARMPGGNYVRYWRGRLLVARGRTLYFSDALRYGLYDQSAGFVTFEARIAFIEPVEGGVYVGLHGIGTHFLAGEAPEKWERKVADILPPQPSTSLVISTAQMKLDLQSKPEWVAIWLTHRGFAIGLPSGNVMHPQADLLSGLPLGTGSLHFEGDRLIALSQ